LNTSTVMIAVLAALAVGLGVYVAFLLSGKKSALDKARANTRAEAEKAAEILQSSKKEAANILKEASLQAKDHLLQVKIDFEKETRTEERAEPARETPPPEGGPARPQGRAGRGACRRVHEEGAGDREQERKLEAVQADLDARIAASRVELERVAGLSAEQAKAEIVEMIADEAKMEAGKKIRVMDEEFKEEATQKARKMISLAVQRYAADYVAEHVVSAVPLPSEEMKGRIIGREGRNIRAFEAATGIDVIIDDTPEAVILSGFNPVRREIARIS